MSQKFTMRELNGGDIFTMLAILGKLEIKDEVVELIERQFGSQSNVIELNDHKSKKPTKAEQAALDLAAEKRGIRLMTDIGFTLLRHVNDAKDDVNAFLAELTDTRKEEIEALNMIQYTELLFAFGKKEELKDFFKSISSVLGLTKID